MKWSALFYAATIGVMDRCRTEGFSIAKIRAAQYYLRFIKLLRMQMMASVLAIVAAFTVANLLAVAEMAILLYSPWETPQKVIAALAVGVIGFGLTLAAILAALAENKWMVWTGADQVVAEAIR